MARIPDEEIQRLKQDVSLVRLCERYHIELTPTGKNLVGVCPWHPDDTPSFVVTPAKNLWHCMGACAEGGDVFRLVQKAEKVSFRRAAEILRELSGAVPASPTINTHTGTTHPILVDSEQDLSDHALLRQVIDFYHRAFLTDPKARQYLERRHCLHPEAITRFRIGYANRTLGYRIPSSTVDGKRLKGRLQALGILRKSGHEHLSGSVVFPLFGLQGEPQQLYGRKITARLRKGTPNHLYLEQPLNGIWNHEGLVQQPTWIVCEGILDALTLWCHGLRHVTCCFGTNTVPGDLWALLRQVRPTTVILAFDTDAAGNRAAEKLAPKLAAEAIAVHRLRVPQGKDINGYVGLLAQKDTHAIPGVLQGLCVDAPLMQRADAGCVRNAVPEPVIPDRDPRAPGSSLAAFLAAKQENPSDTDSTEPEPQAAHDPSPSVPESPHAQTDPPELSVLQRGDDIELTRGDRVYRVRGLAKNQTVDVMRVNLRAMNPDGYHIDSLDLYNARHRTAYINTAATELRVTPEVVKKDLGRVLLKLEQVQDEQIARALEPETTVPEMTVQEREEALNLLKSPDLLEQILQAFDTSGLVGERTNKLTGYLAAVSRKLDKPLAVVIQSSSASGKSTLMEAILDMMPEEDRIQYSAMTGQSLFYFGEKNLKHKILAIVEEEGVRQASYALKLLQSEGKLTIASTGKDPATGQLVTKEYHVEGPVMIFTTTTAIDIDEELLNRCLILTIDESREQTRAIHRAQRKAETLEGLIARLEKHDVFQVLRNAQRLLRPLHVVNPYAEDLSFLDETTRTRRDHKKYLTLIRAHAFLHQYQRRIRTLAHNSHTLRYIEVQCADIAMANQLACEVLGRSLDDLSPQSRRFLELVIQMVRKACATRGLDRCDYRFTQRDIRAFTGWSDFQVKSHLRKLVSLEYVLMHQGGRGQRAVYELLYNGEGRDGSKFLMCLRDVNELTRMCGYDANREHETQNREHAQHAQEHENTKREVPGSIRGAPGELSGSMAKNGTISMKNKQLEPHIVKTSKNADPGAVKKSVSSYHSHRSGVPVQEVL